MGLILAVFLLLLPAGFATVSCRALSRAVRLRRHGHTVLGSVTAIEPSSSGKVVRVRYVVDGRPFETEAMWSPAWYSVGEAVRGRYLPDSPEVCLAPSRAVSSWRDRGVTLPRCSGASAAVGRGGNSGSCECAPSPSAPSTHP